MMSKINLQELRFKLKDSELTTETMWIEISGVRCFVHPKSPGGWRRVMKIKEMAGPEWIIYYAHDELLFDYKSAIKSAQSYFPNGKVLNVDVEQDVVYIDPNNKLSFEEVKSKWSAVRDTKPNDLAFAVPKLQTLEMVMPPKAKERYKGALQAITKVLLDRNSWTYDTQRLTTTKMYTSTQISLEELTEPEAHLVLKAIKSFFEPSADQITYKQVGSRGNFLFIIEV